MRMLVFNNQCMKHKLTPKHFEVTPNINSNTTENTKIINKSKMYLIEKVIHNLYIK